MTQDPSGQSVTSALQKFYGHALQTYVAKGIFFVIAMTQSVITARVLGPEGRGLLAIVMSAQELGAQVGQLGGQEANSYFAARNPSLGSRLFANSVIQGLGVGSLFVCVAVIIFQIFPTLAPLQHPVFFVGLAAIPVFITNNLLFGLLFGCRKITEFNRILFVRNTVSLLLVGGFAFFNELSPIVVISVEILTGLFMLLLSTLVFRRLFDLGAGPSLQLAKDMLPYSLKSSLSILARILIEVSDIFMIKHFLGVEAAGFYAVAKRLFSTFQLLATTASSLLLPGITSLDHWRDKWQVTRHVCRRLIGVLVVPAIVGIFVMPQVVVLLFGEEFRPAASPAIYLSFAGVAFGAVMLIQSFFGSIGNPLTVSYIWISMVVVKITTNYLLIPVLGIDGPAVSSILCYTLIFAIQYAILRGTLATGANPLTDENP